MEAIITKHRQKEQTEKTSAGAHLGGTRFGQGPDGKAPIDMQLSFLGRHRQLRAVVRRMLDWQPERIILAHGRCYERDAVAELKRAFRWVL